MKRLRNGIEFLQKKLHGIAYLHTFAALLGDNHSIETIACRLPLVFRCEPILLHMNVRRSKLTIESIINPDNETVDECNKGKSFAKCRETITYTYFQSAEIKVRTNVPVEILDGSDSSCCYEGFIVFLKTFPVRKIIGKSSCWK